MFDRVYQQNWMALEKNIREHLSSLFNIPRSGIVEIMDDRVIVDGHTNEDLAIITSELLMAYTGSREKFPTLWELAIERARSEVSPPIDLTPIINGENHVQVKVERYCDTCISTKGRHRKGCPKFK